MPRAMSLRSRDLLHDRITAEPRHFGARLGAAAHKCRVPADALAPLFNVTTDTIYRWMYHDEVPSSHHATAQKILLVMQRAFRAGRVPMVGTVRERVRLFNELYDE